MGVYEGKGGGEEVSRVTRHDDWRWIRVEDPWTTLTIIMLETIRGLG